MEIKKTAVAGTLESSDCMVTVEPAAKGLELELESAVIRQYGRQIRKVALETLKRLGVKKARVECAVMRAAEHEGRINWGGMIK